MRHARLLFHQLDLLRADVLEPGVVHRGNAVLLANSSALARPIAAFVGDVQRRHHGTVISIRESASEVTVHALLERSASIGIVSDAASRVEGLEAVELGADPIVLIVPRGHALSSREGVNFGAALEYDWITRGEGSALYSHLAVQAQRIGKRLRACVSVPSIQDVIQLVAQGCGVSAVPAISLGAAGGTTDVACISIEEAWAQRRLLVCRHPLHRDQITDDLFASVCQRWRAAEETMHLR